MRKINWLKVFLLTSLFLFITFVAGGAYYLNLSRSTQEFIPQLPIQKATPKPTPQLISIVLAGDVMLGRSVTIESLDKRKDPKYPFLKVSNVLNGADIVFVNLENPVIEDCPRIEHGFTFCSPPEMLEGLIYSGVDVVTIANNHTLNFGVNGFEETKKHLQAYGIDSVGYNNLIVKEIKGIKIGFLGFDFLTKVPTAEDFDLIRKGSDKVDFLIVGVHWGVEYQNAPKDFQRQWARQMVSTGADVISGHHPHWVQIDEVIEGVPVYYSLGNFVFDQMWSEEPKKGRVIELTVKDGKIQESKRFDTYIADWAQPEFVN